MDEQLTRREKKLNIKRFVPWLVVIAVIGGGLFYLFRPATPSESVQEEVVLGETVFSENDHIKGNKESGILVYEYSDFQCPACAYYQTILKEVLEKKSEEFALVYRYFPLGSIHANADISAYAAEAASKQGKFWEMHDKLFENQSGWEDSNNPKDIFIGYAQELELDVEQFKSDIDSNEIKSRVDNDYVSAVSLKLNSTPTFILDDNKITFRDAGELIKIIESKAGEN